MLPFIVIGFTDGSIYAIAALGLALSYKTSGVFNFAHGAVAVGAAYVFYQCHTLSGLPWPAAAVIAVFGYGTLAGFLFERLAARIASTATSFRITATLGALLIIQSLAQAHYGASPLPFPRFLPHSSAKVFGVSVEADQFITMGVAALAAIGLAVFFRRSRLGTAMRAVVDEPALLDITGTDPTQVRRVAWVIGTWFASVSGILIAPRLGLDAGLLTLLVVQAYAAAAIGAFTNLPLVYIGGLVVGVLQQVTYFEVTKLNNFTLGNLSNNVPFILLFAILLILPRTKLRELGRQVRMRSIPAVIQPGKRIRWATTGIGILLLLLVPQVVGTELPVWSAALTDVVLFLSLAVLVRTSNQVSLCQVGFAAVGASTFAHVAGSWGVPWLLSLLLAGLVAVPIGAFIAVPAIRLAGLFLALATFGFGILLADVGYRSFLMFGSNNSLDAPRPGVPALHLTSDTGYYYVILAMVGLCCLLVALIDRSRLGRLLRGLADSPTALMTHGANVNVTRVMVFGVSAFLAGISGALFAPLNGSVSGRTFPYFDSIVLIAVLAVAGYASDLFARGPILASFLAAGLFKVAPGYISDATFALYLQVGFGIAAVAVAWAASTDQVRGKAPNRSRRRPGLSGPVRSRSVPRSPWSVGSPVSSHNAMTEAATGGGHR